MQYDSRFSHLLENKDADGFFSDLSDTKYKQFITGGDFSIGLEGYVLSVYRYFKKKITDTRALDIFMIKEDALNFIGYASGGVKKDFFRSSVLKEGWWDKEEEAEDRWQELKKPHN